MPHVQTSHLHLSLPGDLFPSGFLTKILYTFFIPSGHATCATYLALLNFITLIIFGEAYKS